MPTPDLLSPRRRRGVAPALLALLSAAPLACGHRGEQAPAASDAGAGAGGSGSAIAPPTTIGPAVQLIDPDYSLPQPPPVELPRQVSFQLIDDGQAPRRPLRYAVTNLAAAEARIGSRVRTRTLDNGTWSEAIALPELRYGLALTPGATAGETATVLVRGLVAEIADEADTIAIARQRAGEYLARYRQLVEQQRATVSIDARGQLGTVTIDGAGAAPAATITELQQLWLTSAVPVPVEAVGVGARWRVTTQLRRGAAIVEQTGEYELLEIGRDALSPWRIAIRVTQIGEPQTIALAPKDGAAAQLGGLVFEAKGEVSIDPRSPLPATGTLSVELRVHLRMPGAGAQLQLIDESVGTVTIRGAEAAAPPPPP